MHLSEGGGGKFNEGRCLRFLHAAQPALHRLEPLFFQQAGDATGDRVHGPDAATGRRSTRLLPITGFLPEDRRRMPMTVISSTLAIRARVVITYAKAIIKQRSAT